MSDRRRMSLQSAYPSDQWNGVAQPHTSMNYSSSYSASAQPPNAPYRADTQAANAAYSQDGYYAAAPRYASGSGSGSRPGYHHQSAYPYAQQPHPSHAQPHTQGYPQPYAHSPTSPTLSSRPRSHSVYVPQQAAPIMVPHPQYPQQVPLGQPGSPYGDYPSSGARPFTCDMCALSFNRQHDLKRHRETHTGEKPYLCNGGCGKTFTRKDALKRHQLVKGCGKVDDSLP
ncbi:hypothetical protein B0H17DRAFT_1074479 [Mycena rosella]|uniref:C2H2-type domain-containing protein n=1 Tax=Mycena rosella TaxID=1033263 RepID=A0AAD7DB08_MYCRO|nr:hypothetical protein B0H17DRAFT_1074479 [Mycena rosella]